MKKIPVMLALAVSFVLPATADEHTRTLSFYHTHTGKSLTVDYKVGGEFQKEALLQLRELLADWRDCEQGDIDPAFANADRVIEAVYRTDPAYHAQMEPMNATASVSADASGRPASNFGRRRAAWAPDRWRL